MEENKTISKSVKRIRLKIAGNSVLLIKKHRFGISLEVIRVYKHAINFEIENNTSKYNFLLPQEMIKEKKDWKMIRRYLSCLNSSTTRK